MAGKPEAEIDITEELIRRLLEDQHPDLAQLPLTPLDSGWDNVIFRLGADLSVRLPRRAAAAPLLANEQIWLPVVAEGLPIAAPVPVRIGRPAVGYPWPWSVLPWFEGHGADRSPPRDGEADRFAAFLRALHRPAPADAPRNPLRGVPLRDRAGSVEARIGRLANVTSLITPAVERVWRRGLAAALAGDDARWLHGDLHAQNVLVAEGRISAVIDWGDMTGGDPATDLAAAWSLFAARADRTRLLDLYAPDQPTLERAMAWAVLFGVFLLDAGLEGSPRHAAQGRDILLRLHGDDRMSHAR
jgi:aminoglycoside phosphotransferase (APT) family kinase protein